MTTEAMRFGEEAYGDGHEVEGHVVDFGGIECLAIDIPGVDVVLKLPGRSMWKSISEEIDLKDPVPIVHLACDPKGRHYPPTQLRLPCDGRVITFPYVVSPHVYDYYFVIDNVELSVGTRDGETKWSLKYRVTCPACREGAERLATRMFTTAEWTGE